MRERIEIPLSKKKIYLKILGCLLFVVAGIWLFFNASLYLDFPLKLFRNPMVIKGVGILSILFFGTIAILHSKKIFDKNAGLIIDSSGITDNSSATSVGLIEWNDIFDIKTKKIMSTKFLLINIKNPEKYIGKAKSATKAKLMRSNMKMYGTPLSITSNNLKYDFEKLEQLIQTEFKQNKKVREQRV
ncbi:STM3941 family protein [Cellulophaga omnivescoria]|uniref:STM3941 family protein n=1 Tax=Cellulophaga omnivescoria TaxID=1888890 RepID=UPI000986A8E7|nr:STM3941 family protein [Cellulophaga omnivescoria]